MRDHKVNPMRCPACDAELNGAFNTETDRRPRPGDRTFCLDCRAILLFDGDEKALTLRRPTDDEERELLADPRIQRIAAAIRAVRGG